MLQLGQYQKLTVEKLEAHGAYLQNLSGDRVLLPTKYLPEGLQEEDEIEVFVYKDNEDRLISTTLKPAAVLNGIAAMKVRTSNEIGAFMDWGIAKDLLVPHKEQEQPLIEGQTYMVRVELDHQTDRLYGTTKIGKFLRNEISDLEKDQEVDLMLWKATDLGWKVIINGEFQGLLFQSDIHQKVQAGNQFKGYVKQIREDGKVDVTLNKAGYENLGPQLERLREALKRNKGFLPLTDNSSPEDISAQLGMSKKTFKKAVGALYKLRLITLEKNGIRLK